MVLPIGQPGEESEEADQEDRENEPDGETNPERREYPPPRPGDVVRQFEGDEDDGKETRKSNTTRP